MGKNKFYDPRRSFIGSFDVLGKLMMACVFVGFAVPLEMFAQAIEDEIFDFNRPESWAMKYFASVGLMNGYGPPEKLKFGEFQLRGELANIPRLSKAKRTVGFYGSKEDNLNKAPVLFRPTATMGITESISASLSWVPPIEVFDRLKTDMLAFSFNARVLEKKSFSLGFRMFGQYNTAKGDFTCSADIVGKGDEKNPFGCVEASNDTFITRNYGAEVSFAYELPFLKNTKIFATSSYQHLDLEFQVRAKDFDMRNLVTDGSTRAYSLGVRRQLRDKLAIAGSLFYTPLNVRRQEEASVQNDSLFNLRLALEYRL